ncbi:glycosyltransferase [Candidatus Methanoperedens nitroreducens]|uniref:Glycosyltransferase n=1 Tax=Candidatus Methanoperedens nitratireducens TaxID=1392998 RepID=A0A062V536_9EURY|nr:glycosyltransferase family 4 protein [Candidatus Methanoperedens nitroreducens]KCZ71728.1 glycosyltransferase [Candidatus Methanoperedens nitroreducens]MDJ1422299.1 glycosyltransferase family 4 protein [Candidatus Methanoperedens sp.]
MAWKHSTATEIHLKGILYNFPSEHELFVICPSAFDFHDSFNLKIIPLGLETTSPKFLYNLIKFILKSFLIGLKTGRKESIDLIYVRHGINSFSAYLLSKILKIPYVIEVNGILHQYGEIEYAFRPNKIILIMFSYVIRIVEKIVLTNASYVFVSTSGKGIIKMLKYRFNIAQDKIVPLHNGVDINIFKPIDTAIARKKLNLNLETKYVIFTGSLEQWQGLSYLVEAVPIVLKKHPNTVFLIVGDGQFKDYILYMINKLKIQKNIRLIGRVPHKEIVWYINSADICIAPYDTSKKDLDFSPLKIFEYMACGKPVISTDIWGIKQYLNGCGLIKPPDNAGELSDAIIYLLDHKEICEKLSCTGYNKATKEYSWGRVTEEIALYCSKLKQKFK